MALVVRRGSSRPQLLCLARAYRSESDIMSTGFSSAESGAIRIGDTVAVFAQCPIGLYATAGARLMGAIVSGRVDTRPW
jgi:threonine dehydrogenase-like Zn-dependent dehydrogenase